MPRLVFVYMEAMGNLSRLLSVHCLNLYVHVDLLRRVVHPTLSDYVVLQF